jgi:4-amino-4-deoxy-L-arabinose transferase-like glycosyltransferase
MFKKITFPIALLGLLVVFALLLRSWQLGFVPHGMTWDEAAIGYNGYAVLTTRRDEWLKKLPISFRSFGDYKAPLAIYINGIFTYTFGSSLTTIRLPFMLSGVLAIITMYWLMNELLLSQAVSEKKATFLGLAAAGLLTVSTWHIHFSRVGFESGLALTLTLLCIASLLRAVRLNSQTWWIVAAITGASCLYAYHSTKIALPLLLLLVVWLVTVRRFLNRRVLVAIVLGSILITPLVYDMLFADGLTRASTLLINKPLSFTTKLMMIASNWQKQLSMDALFFGWTDSLRHGTGKYGVLYLLDLVPLLWLTVRAITHRWFAHQYSLKHSKLLVFWLSWIAIGLLPAVLSDQSPHPNRALLALPGFIGLIVLGWDDLLRYFKITQAAFLVGIVYILLLGSFIQYYFTTYAHTSAADFYDGNHQAAQRAVQIEKQGVGGVRPAKILFTSDYGQPYIFILLAKQLSPIEYQGGGLANYEFPDTISTGDLMRPNTLLVASAEDDISLDWADEIIYGSDGEVAFKLYYPKENPQ